MDRLLKQCLVSYQILFFNNPKWALLAITLLTLSLGWFSQNFRLDASGETLVLENDQSLTFYREVRERYGSDDFLILTYTPSASLFSAQSLNNLTSLSKNLEHIHGVDSVFSILNIPLLNSPKQTLTQVEKQIRTLASTDIDIDLAKTEITDNAYYNNLLISPNGQTAALIINLSKNALLTQYHQERYNLQAQSSLSTEQQQRLSVLDHLINEQISSNHDNQSQLIKEVRATYQPYTSASNIHLGGVPMITADSIDFIRHDIKSFGLGVFVFLVVLLTIAFNKIQWVILPLVTCLVASILMLGLLAILDWPVTVVSANFISLMLIITLSLTIHLIVRYQELHWHQPQLEQKHLVFAMVKKKFIPCLFTTLTTMVAFSSLLISQIRPVIDFGLMMTIGMIISFVLAFTLFPASLLLLKPGTPVNQRNVTGRITKMLGYWVNEHPRTIVIYSFLFLLAALWGFKYLSVENRFIDYFKESTEIYQGMSLIDKELGGTTPLDVIINAPIRASEPEQTEFLANNEDDDLYLELLDEQSQNAEQQSIPMVATGYWFNPNQIHNIGNYQHFIESVSGTGKVLSLASGIDLVAPVVPEIKEDLFVLSLAYQKLPEKLKSILFYPYISADGNQTRLSVRVFESDLNLKRSQLLTDIKQGLTSTFELQDEQIQFSGMLVLYNNLLNSLFNSQIKTIGAVFIAILFMFLLLFRNIRLAIIALIPNICAAISILGLMGWLGIPLDLMTITIAAICIGIAVDDSIHYVYRIKQEFSKCYNYQLAVVKSHKSIGRAMYYTSLTVTLGFSILTLSNFVPSIYFGILTGLSMLIALFANLTLLPVLIAWLKPLGKERQHNY